MNKDKKDSRINEILTHLACAASAAADSVSDVVQSTGQVVGDKYDVVKLNIELARLQEEQRKLFSDIGRTLFLVKSGEVAADPTPEEAIEPEVSDAQQTIDRLLLLADQKQQEIDDITLRLKKLNGATVCIICGKVADSKDIFCSVCGAKLPKDE